MLDVSFVFIIKKGMLVVSFSEIKSWQHTPYTITYINSRICNLLNQELNCTARTSLWIYKFEYLNKTFRSVGWLHFELTVVHAFVLRRFMINNNFEIVVRLKKCHKFFFMECHRYPGVKRQTVPNCSYFQPSCCLMVIYHPSINTHPTPLSTTLQIVWTTPSISCVQTNKQMKMRSVPNCSAKLGQNCSKLLFCVLNFDCPVLDVLLQLFAFWCLMVVHHPSSPHSPPPYCLYYVINIYCVQTKNENCSKLFLPACRSRRVRIDPGCSNFNLFFDGYPSWSITHHHHPSSQPALFANLLSVLRTSKGQTDGFKNYIKAIQTK